MYLMEWLVVPVVIIFLWYAYVKFFGVNNSNVNYDHLADLKTMPSFVGLLLALAVIILGVIYAGIKAINRWLNNRSSSKVMSNLAYDLCRLYLSEDFVEYCQKFGISMDQNSIIIKSEIMNKCSLHSLARLLSSLFNKNMTSDLKFNFEAVLCSLAVLILDTWSEDQVNSFVYCMYLENIILGEDMRYVIDRLKVNREASEFNRGIENRLAELDRLREEKSLVIMTNIDNQFKYSNYLITGGSAFKSLVRDKLSFGWLSKIAMVK